MTIYTDECCDCATGVFPCLGRNCPNRNVPHHICDLCGQEDDLSEIDGLELCASCQEKTEEEDDAL